MATSVYPSGDLSGSERVGFATRSVTIPISQMGTINLTNLGVRRVKVSSYNFSVAGNSQTLWGKVTMSASGFSSLTSSVTNLGNVSGATAAPSVKNFAITDTGWTVPTSGNVTVTCATFTNSAGTTPTDGTFNNADDPRYGRNNNTTASYWGGFNFVMVALPPTVTTSFSGSTATIQADVADNGGSTVSGIAIDIYSNAGRTTLVKSASTTTSGSTTFSTTYNSYGTFYYRAYINNGVGISQYTDGSYTISEPPPSYTYRTVYFDGNGGTSASASLEGRNDSSFAVTLPSATRTNFTFNGWYTASSGGTRVGGAGNTYNITSNGVTLYAQWSALEPTFSDSTITTTALLAKNISTNPDRQVTASPVSSYSIVYSGSGTNPTSWLTINSSGELSGVPPQIGVYTFLIRATNSGINKDTSTITLTVLPPGDKMTGPDTSTSLSVAKRYDGTNWIDLSVMKRFDGTNWVDISHS